MNGSRGLTAQVAALCAVGVLGCQDPTEITVAVTTDIACADFKGASITVGRLSEIESAPPTSTTTICDATGHVGTLVVVPSGDRHDAVAVKIVGGLGRSPEECAAPYGAGCVVARRALHYLPQTNQRVQIRLEKACDGIPCGATETCAGGACRPAQLASGACSSGAGCDASALPPATTGDTSGLQGGAPWPMYGHDPAHTSRSPYVGPRTANVRWRYPGLGSASISPAVGADGAVYYASSLLDTLVDPTAATWASIAIDSHGVQRWSTPLTKGAFASGPALGRDGTIYEAFDDGSLAAFDPAGHQKLSVQVSNPGQLHSAPAMGGDGTLYVGSIDKAIHALDAAGHEKWRYAATDWIDESSPAIGRDGTVYFGSIDHVLYAVTPAGALRWSFAADAPLYCSPSVGADGTVYIGSEAGTLYAVGPDGALRWSFAAGAGIRTAPALRDDGVIYVLSSNGHARALTPAGALLWDFDAGVTERPGFHGAAVDATGALYFRVGRELFAVSRDGAKLWQFEGDSDDGGIVVIGGDRVLYTTSGNGLIAIGP